MVSLNGWCKAYDEEIVLRNVSIFSTAEFLELKNRLKTTVVFLTVTVSPHNEIWRNTITETHSFFRLKKIVYKSIENLSRVWYWKISRKRLQALRKICCYRRFFPDPKRINICYSDISRNFKNIYWSAFSTYFENT